MATPLAKFDRAAAERSIAAHLNLGDKALRDASYDRFVDV